jgi:hypothetical protein
MIRKNAPRIQEKTALDDRHVESANRQALLTGSVLRRPLAHASGTTILARRQPVEK